VARAHVNSLQLEYESFGDPAATPLLLVMGLSYQMIEWDDDLCALITRPGRGSNPLSPAILRAPN